MMFAPVLGCFQLIPTYPIKTIRLLFLSTVPYLSLMVVCITGILTYILTGRAAFLVTGDKAEDTNFYSYPGVSKENSALSERMDSNNGLIRITELIIGVFLTYVCFKTFNLALLAFSLFLVLGYFIYNYGWVNDNDIS